MGVKRAAGLRCLQKTESLFVGPQHGGGQKIIDS